MAHFAELDENSIVLRVLVVQDSEEHLWPVHPFSGTWMKTSYNTRGGVYYGPNTNQPSADQSKVFRKNYAGIGFTYDAQRDAFIPPKPYPSFILDEQTCLWVAPVPYPTDGSKYIWDEQNQSWALVHQ